MLPLLIGIALGAMWTRNKFVWYILISILIMRLGWGVFAKSVSKVKESQDKKMAARNEVVKSINAAVDFTEYGNEVGGKMFDKFYENYTILVNIGILITLCYFIYKRDWMTALICFAILHTFVVLNQIVRKVKHLDNSSYMLKPRVKKGIPIGTKII